MFEIPTYATFVSRDAFGFSSIMLTPIQEQTMAYLDDIDELRNRMGFVEYLNPFCIRENKFSSELMRHIDESSNPLNRAQLSDLYPLDWYTHWEIYVHSLLPMVKAAARTGETTVEEKSAEESRRPFRGSLLLKSFHMGGERSVSALRAFIEKATTDYKKHIGWEWLIGCKPGAANPREQRHYVADVDIDPDSLSNIRARKNIISTLIGGVNLIVTNNVRASVGDIVFVLTTLSEGGIALINIPFIRSGSVVSLVHLCRYCFTNLSLVRTEAGDKLYLCGIGMIPLKASTVNVLYNFHTRSANDADQSFFTRDYQNSDEFTSTLEIVLHANTAIYKSRLEHYNNILSLQREVLERRSMSMFDNMADTLISERVGSTRNWLDDNYFVSPFPHEN